MELREAREPDFEAVVRLVSSPDELFHVYPKGQHPFTVGQLRELAATRKELTALLNDHGKVVGFAGLYNVEAGRSAFVGTVAVKRLARGKGYGRCLMAHMIEQARDKCGVDEVRLSVFNDNLPALLLDSDMGFTP